jgi:xanthine dehydrogenase YagT iron-sulfur-binding subunit
MSDDDPKSRPPGSTRRKFLLTTGSGVAASVVAGYMPALATDVAAESDSALATARPNIEGAVPITLRINGKDRELRVDPRTTLLDCIRETVVLTGTKKGCDHGQCGACTVHVNGRRVNSCLTLALMHDGEEITTIEGLVRLTHCIPCRPRSSLMMGISAVIARQDKSCRLLRCSRNRVVQMTRR